MAGRPASPHPAAGLRPSSVCRLDRAAGPARLADGELQPDGAPVPHNLAADSNDAPAGHRRLSLSLSAGADDSGLLPADAGPHPGGRAAAGPAGRGSIATDGPLPR